MALVAPNEGDTLMLSYIVNKTTPGNPVLRLFVNDLLPDQNTTIGLLTECSSPGYSAITMTGADWTIATVDGVVYATFAPQLFIFSSNTVSTNVYGYYITDSTPKILWIERFTSGPYIMVTSGGQITISPSIYLKTDPDS